VVLKPDGVAIVLGAGRVGLRKAKALSAAGFAVKLVDRRKPSALPRGAGFKRVNISEENLATVLRGASLIVSALNDRPLNSAVSRQCRRAGIPVNVVDDPELCTFTMPAVAARGSLVIAISTSGLAPFLSATLRKELEPLVARRAPLVAIVAEIRQRVPGRAVLGQVFRDGRFRRAVDSGRWKTARSLALQIASKARHAGRRGG